MPTRPRSFRLSDVTYARITRLQRRLIGRSQADVIEMGILHLLATLELGQQVHVTVPSEQRPEEEQERRPTGDGPG